MLDRELGDNIEMDVKNVQLLPRNGLGHATDAGKAVGDYGVCVNATDRVC
jgi:hypothetical protein